MKIESLKLAFFSPTGTTKAVIKGIAKGINHISQELVDITAPGERKRVLETKENELLIVGVPVYMGRVPALLTGWLEGIKACRTPAVCVVVYGNREYDNALLELKNILEKQGCRALAGAAYIGEHSFSDSELPTAENRPDEKDMKHAELFGQKINEKLFSIPSAELIPDINIPGNFPYGGITELWDVDFIEISNECRKCGICAEVCPVGAVDPENFDLVDTWKCITCCACIKKCPYNARTIKEGPVKDASIRLNKLYNKRKDPEFFL